MMQYYTILLAKTQLVKTQVEEGRKDVGLTNKRFTGRIWHRPRKMIRAFINASAQKSGLNIVLPKQLLEEIRKQIGDD